MSLKDYFDLSDVFTYFFRKNDPTKPVSFNLKAMHWINKVSMGLFVICVLVLIYRYFIR